MHLDLPTMFAITGFVTIVAGSLLLFSWLRDRSIVSLAMWGVSFLIMSIGGALAILDNLIPDFFSVGVSSALGLFAYGLTWCAARSFEDRKPLYLLAFAGAAFWVVLCQFDSIYESQFVRIAYTSAIAALYTLLAAVEYLRPRDRALASRWPAIVLLFIQCLIWMLRLVFVEHLPFPAGVLPYDPTFFPIGAFAMLVNNFCLSFLIVNMAKERAELRQRETASLDALTGIANRRTFLASGQRILQRTLASGQPSAMLIFDLDYFKKVNDTFGHQFGDYVLCAFCDTVRDSLRPEDLFARIGGEEFACLLPGASVQNAAAVAERVRAAFEGHRIRNGSQVTNSTVSVGIAVAKPAEYRSVDLQSLLGAADRALYRAKAAGRNRVRQASESSHGMAGPVSELPNERVAPPIQPRMQPNGATRVI
jgi:diguanylate cyclase (GGDEF)-like protein